MDEAQRQPLRHQLGLPRDDALQEGQRAVGLRVMAGNGVLHQQPHAGGIAATGEEFEMADAQVGTGDPGQHGAGQGGFAVDRVAGGHGGQRTRGGHAKRRHRLGHQVFP